MKSKYLVYCNIILHAENSKDEMMLNFSPLTSFCSKCDIPVIILSHKEDCKRLNDCCFFLFRYIGILERDQSWVTDERNTLLYKEILKKYQYMYHTEKKIYPYHKDE